MEFTIKESKIGGKGCFATEDIKDGEVITELKGEEVSLKEIKKRIAEGRENLDDPLQIDDYLYIDLDEPSRTFNHSCDPNSGVRGKNELFAIKDIKKGEEITYDYSTVVGTTVDIDVIWSMNCNCGSRDCRKKIGNYLTIPKKKLEAYKKKGAFPDFIKKQLDS